MGSVTALLGGPTVVGDTFSSVIGNGLLMVSSFRRRLLECCSWEPLVLPLKKLRVVLRNEDIRRCPAGGPAETVGTITYYTTSANPSFFSVDNKCRQEGGIKKKKVLGKRRKGKKKRGEKKELNERKKGKG